MSLRYSLRFRDGERAGESVPIQGSPFLVGRKPGSSFQLLMKSVSGRHAELLQDGGELLIRDLGSTNGTRVNGKRVEESKLVQGDRVFLGNVEFDIVAEGAGSASGDGDTDAVEVGELELELELPDAAPSGPIPAKRAPAKPAPQMPASQAPSERKKPAPTVVAPKPSPEPPAESEASHAISAASLERAAAGGSKLPLVLLALGAVGAGAAWWFFGRGNDESGSPLQAVVEVPGNALASSSFEAAGGWTSRESASDSFRPSPRARVSGARGLRVDLGPGGTAFHESDPVQAGTDRRFRAGASLRRGPDASAALGVMFLGADGDPSAPGPVTVWSTVAEGGAAFGEVALEGLVPNGYERARVVIGAAGKPVPEGVNPEDVDQDAWAEVDDAVLVFENGGKATHKLDEVRFYGIGDPAYAVVVFKIDRVLVSGLRVRERGASGPGQGLVPLSLSEEAQGVRVAWSATQPVTLSARLEARLVDDGVATLGDGGYAPRGGAFEASGVTDILAGSGIDLLRVALGTGQALLANPAGSGVRIEVHMPAKASILLQTRFRDERTEALNLATSARQATARGDRGKALGYWKDLLTRYPYEAGAVAEADQAHSALVQQGLGDLAALDQQIERARFFGLADLFATCRSRAEQVQQAYAGSEVADTAGRLAASLGRELQGLMADSDQSEVQRLQSIHAALEQGSAPSLAAEVAGYIADQEQGQEQEHEHDRSESDQGR